MESSRSDFLSKRRVWRLEPLALSKSRPIGHPGLDTDWEVNVDCCAMGARSIEPKERLRLFRRPRRRAARSLKNAILRKHPSATLQRVWSWRRRSSRIPSFFDHKPQDPDSLPKNRLCATANSCLICPSASHKPNVTTLFWCQSRPKRIGGKRVWRNGLVPDSRVQGVRRFTRRDPLNL